MNVSNTIHDSWSFWIKEFINQLLSFNHFSSVKLTEVVLDDLDSKTYAIQCTAVSKEDLDKYIKHKKASMQQMAFQKYGEALLTFDTSLKVIETFTK